MDKDFRKRIAVQNLNLPLHEIKKKIKKLYPDITNEEVEKILSCIYKEKKVENQDKRRKKSVEKER